MIVGAHFTLHEMPGTIAILLTGVVLGVVLGCRLMVGGRRLRDLFAVLLVGVAVLTLIVSLDSHDGSLAVFLQLAWLTVAGGLLFRQLFRLETGRHDGEVRGPPPQRSPDGAQATVRR